VNKEYKLEVRHGLSIINIILISLLSLGIIFIGCIEYLRQQDGEHKEIIVNWDYPYITYSGEDIIIIPLFFGIGLLVANKKRKKVIAIINVTKSKITITYLKRTYILDMSSIKNIKYNYDEKNKKYVLQFYGNKNMLTDYKNRKSNKYELIFLEDVTKLYEKILKYINLENK